MSTQNVGIRQLKSRLSEYMRHVKAGETIIITERGVPVGRIVPEGPGHETSLDDKMQRLLDAGLAEWNGERPQADEPVALKRAGVSVTDLIAEMRE